MYSGVVPSWSLLPVLGSWPAFRASPVQSIGWLVLGLASPVQSIGWLVLGLASPVQSIGWLVLGIVMEYLTQSFRNGKGHQDDLQKKQ